MTRDELLRRYVEERDHYDRFAKHLKDLIEDEARRRGLPIRIDARAKEVHSFGKKLVVRQYESYEQVTDKAGVRVIVDAPYLVAPAEELIDEMCVTHKRQDKAEAMDPKVFDYQGLHLDVSMREPGEFEALRCEVQIHTRAQSMWSDATHDVLYKGMRLPDRELRRTFHRLNALVETFDIEMTRAHTQLAAEQGYEQIGMLLELERHFFRLTASRNYNPELSLFILENLRSLLSDEERRDFAGLLDRFASANRDKLLDLYGRYREDYRHALFFQPEALLIFERLEMDAAATRDRWTDFLDPELLEGLEAAWGQGGAS